MFKNLYIFILLLCLFGFSRGWIRPTVLIQPKPGYGDRNRLHGLRIPTTTYFDSPYGGCNDRTPCYCRINGDTRYNGCSFKSLDSITINLNINNEKTFPPVDENKQFKILCRSWDYSNTEDSNIVFYDLISYTSSYQRNLDFYIVGDWEKISDKGNIGLLGSKEGGPNSVYQRLTYVNSTHLTIRITPELNAIRNSLVLYDLNTYTSVCDIGPANDFKPWIDQYYFSGDSEFHVFGAVLTDRSIEIGEYPNNVSCPLIAGPTYTKIGCKPPSYLLSAKSFIFSIYGKSRDPTSTVTYTQTFPHYFSSFKNLQDGKTCELPISFPSISHSQSLTIHGLSAAIKPISYSPIKFEYPPEAKCGTAFIMLNGRRTSNNLDMCPTPNITDIITRPDEFNGNLLTFKGDFLYNSFLYGDGSKKSINFVILYRDGSNSSCIHKMNGLSDWNSQDRTYSISCFISKIYTFKIRTETILGQIGIFDGVAYPPTITRWSKTFDYLVPSKITITGTQFGQGMLAKVADAPCSNPVVNNEGTELVCDFSNNVSDPNDLYKPLPLSVSIDSFNTTEKIQYNIRNPFIYNATSTTYGVPGNVTISGYGFLQNELTVSIGNTLCLSPILKGNQIICVFASTEPLTIQDDYNTPLEVRVMFNSIYIDIKPVFKYNRPPAISNASQLVYGEAGLVTITGTDFVFDSLNITIGNEECSSPTLNGTTKIICHFNATVPTDDYFIDPLLVVIAGVNQSAFYYTRPDPIISSSSSTFFNQESTVTIKGNYLAYKGNDYIVQIGGQPCILADPTHQPTKDEIICNYKSNVQVSDYSTPLEVLVNIDSKYVGNNSVFYYSKPNPLIISASSTVYNTASNVTIIGSQFIQDDLVVKIGQVECLSPLVSDNGTRIVCEFPSTAAPIDYKTPLEVYVGIKSIYSTINSVFYYTEASTLPPMESNEPTESSQSNQSNKPSETNQSNEFQAPTASSTQATKSLSNDKLVATLVCLVMLLLEL